MTTLKVVAIRDRMQDAYMQPWFVPTIGMAIRAFQDEINKPDNPLNAHPEDYDLYYIAEFDNNHGVFTDPPDGIQQIAIGKQLLK